MTIGKACLQCRGVSYRCNWPALMGVLADRLFPPCMTRSVAFQSLSHFRSTHPLALVSPVRYRIHWRRFTISYTKSIPIQYRSTLSGWWNFKTFRWFFWKARGKSRHSQQFQPLYKEYQLLMRKVEGSMTACKYALCIWHHLDRNHYNYNTDVRWYIAIERV